MFGESGAIVTPVDECPNFNRVTDHMCSLSWLRKFRVSKGISPRTIGDPLEYIRIDIPGETSYGWYPFHSFDNVLAWLAEVKRKKEARGEFRKKS